jgi:hypothetical protein
MAELKELTEEQLQKEMTKISQSYRAALTDAALRARLKTILGYLQSKSVADPAKEQKRIALLVHEHIRRQLSDHALLLFLYMEKTDDFGQMGEQRVSISFCRNILDLPASQEVTQEDADRFRELVDAFEKKLNISSVAKIKEHVGQFQLDILGEKLNLFNDKPINQYLEFLGIPFRIFVGNMKGLTTFIYGNMETKTITGKDIVIIKKEVVRSPHYVLSIAAGQGSVGVFIRRESCETIFYNKWVSFFSLTPQERQIVNVHPHSGIREGIKEAALKHYQVSSAAELEKIKETFIQEMIEGIFYHEVGHEVGEKDVIPLEENCIAKSRGVVGDDVIVVLKEAIADWAPAAERLSGPLWHFLQVSKKDKLKATRLIYVYLSDNWFIDADDEFMGIQTDLLCALILDFIQQDGEIDYTRLEKEFQGVYQFILKRYLGILERMFQILREATYSAGIHRINFDTLEKELYKVYTKDNKQLTMEELRAKTTYWVHLMGLVKSFSQETYNKLEEWIAESAKEVKLAVLEKVTRGELGKYNNSLREYIVQKMAEIGVFKKVAAPKVGLIVFDLAKSLKMPDTIEKKVAAQMEKILDGDSIDIAINYEGKPDPFWAVFQELLLRSGYGNIRSGMAVGENISSNDTPEEKKKHTLEALESIRDQIESEMYLEVKLLRVNSRYIDEDTFEGVLGEVKFYDGKELKEKLQSVQYIEIKTNSIFEVYIPLKRGYVDWNTSQAIWRINQEIRPEDYLKQWTIDAEFLKSVLEVFIANSTR